MTNKGHISSAREGTAFEVFGTSTTLLADGPDTASTFAVAESDIPPGLGVPPHSHQASDEAVYVLAGRLMVQIGERQAEATSGTVAIAPRGVVHSFHNASDQPARILLLVTGEHGMHMSNMLAALSELPPGEPDMAAMVALMAKYDMTPAG